MFAPIPEVRLRRSSFSIGMQTQMQQNFTSSKHSLRTDQMCVCVWGGDDIYKRILHCTEDLSATVPFQTDASLQHLILALGLQKGVACELLRGTCLPKEIPMNSASSTS